MKAQKYRRIAEDLRRRILSGELASGEQLPTHESLAEQWQTTGMTVRRALAELTREGLTETRPTVGTFVRFAQRKRLDLGSTVYDFSPSFPSFGDRLLHAIAGPDRPLRDTLQVSRIIPPDGVADRLRTGNAEVILRHSVRLAGADKISIGNTYLPLPIAAGTPTEDPDPDLNVMRELLATDNGVVELVDELFVRRAIAAESREMRWPDGMPVLIQLCTGYARSGTPVACWVQVLPGDTWIIAERRHLHDSDQRWVAS
jgi:GntR family transcriptional regulator